MAFNYQIGDIVIPNANVRYIIDAVATNSDDQHNMYGSSEQGDK